MSASYAFKNHTLTPDQRLWLEEVARGGTAFSPRAARIALQGRIAPGFSPDVMDPRLYGNRRLTPVGLWHVDPNSPLFTAIDQAVRAIRDRILKKPDLKSVTAAEIAAETGMTEPQVAEALFAAAELGTRFFKTAHGVPGNPAAYAKLELPDDDDSDDEYLSFTNVEDLMERFYQRRGIALKNSLSYSEQTSPDSEIPDHPGTYSAEAARAIFQAIQRCIERDGRAHVGNVPREAETILLRGSGGTIDTAEANREIQQAIAGLAHEERIAVAAERFRDWRILKPMKLEDVSMPNKRVFIVHGHNGEAKESVARFVEKLGLEAVILHERANRGRTIITKFHEESDGVSFAVVLMTPDDEGRAVGTANANSRARQNVVFELGFFIGKLGPDRVAAMVKGNIEKPSDFDGVVYISLDSADWRVNLASELKAAGLDGDWSKVLP